MTNVFGLIWPMLNPKALYAISCEIPEVHPTTAPTLTIFHLYHFGGIFVSLQVLYFEYRNQDLTRK